MKSYPYVILGGGLVAGYAAQAFVQHGVPQDQLCILAGESHLPYERPPLSKAFLRGTLTTAELLINPPAFYVEHGIEVRLDTTVERVDFANKRLHTKNETIGYEKLLIATGARPRPLALDDAEVAGVYTLRQLEDAQQIQAAACPGQRAVVIGGGFIGMEVAAVLQQRGVTTTLVFSGSHLGPDFFTTRMADFFTAYYQARGVTIHGQGRVIGLHREADQVTHVTLATGPDLAADLVVAGIGVYPNVELFAQSELQLAKGVIVNEFLETNLPNVYAAGDVACYPDHRFQEKWRRVEHWDNAVAQGQHAVRVMLGERSPFLHLPYLFSDLFDLSYELWGDPAGAETIVYRGDVERGSFSVWWLSPASTLQAAFVMQRPDEERTLAQQWLKAGTVLDGQILSDPTAALASAPYQAAIASRSDA